jgi:hypothetical protein
LPASTRSAGWRPAEADAVCLVAMIPLQFSFHPEASLMALSPDFIVRTPHGANHSHGAFYPPENWSDHAGLQAFRDGGGS